MRTNPKRPRSCLTLNPASGGADQSAHLPRFDSACRDLSRAACSELLPIAERYRNSAAGVMSEAGSESRQKSRQMFHREMESHPWPFHKAPRQTKTNRFV